MKRALVLSLLATAMLGLAALAAGPSINPWFEINVPDMSAAVPTLDGGVSVEGMLSPAWVRGSVVLVICGLLVL